MNYTQVQNRNQYKLMSNKLITLKLTIKTNLIIS